MLHDGDEANPPQWLAGSAPDPLVLGSLADVKLGLTGIQASPSGVGFTLVAIGDDASLTAFYEGVWAGVRQPGRLDRSDVIVRLECGSSIAQLNVDEGQGPALTLMGTQTAAGRFDARIHAGPSLDATTWRVSVEWLGGQVTGAVDTETIAAAMTRAVQLD